MKQPFRKRGLLDGAGIWLSAEPVLELFFRNTSFLKKSGGRLRGKAPGLRVLHCGGIDGWLVPATILSSCDLRCIMLRNSNYHLRWCLPFVLALFACGFTGCVIGPTNGCVLSDEELDNGFPICGFIDRPDEWDWVQLEIYNHVEGCWFPTPAMVNDFSGNPDEGFQGYGARWYYWEFTGFIPSWGWSHVEGDHYTAEIRIVRRNGSRLWTFNDTLKDHFDPVGGSLEDLWINAGAGTTITLHAYLDEEQAFRLVHPRNR